MMGFAGQTRCPAPTNRANSPIPGSTAHRNPGAFFEPWQKPKASGGRWPVGSLEAAHFALFLN